MLRPDAQMGEILGAIAPLSAMSTDVLFGVPGPDLFFPFFLGGWTTHKSGLAVLHSCSETLMQQGAQVQILDCLWLAPFW